MTPAVVARSNLPASRDAAPASEAAGTTPHPVRPPSIDLAAWVAQRQADLLLYLGAFLLVVAAILFTDYRGALVPPALRVPPRRVHVAVCRQRPAASSLGARPRGRSGLPRAGGAAGAAEFRAGVYRAAACRGHTAGMGVAAWVQHVDGALRGAVPGRHGHGYRFLAGFAAVNAWEALFAVLDVAADCLPAWRMLLALLVAVGATRAPAFRRGFLASAAGVAGLSLLGAHVVAAFSDDVPAQLPATYLLLTTGLVVVGRSTRWPALLPAAASSATGLLIASMWAAGLNAEWLWYPPPPLGAVTLASRRYWAPRSTELARFGWLFAAVWGATPAVVGSGFEEPRARRRTPEPRGRGRCGGRLPRSRVSPRRLDAGTGQREANAA